MKQNYNRMKQRGITAKAVSLAVLLFCTFTVWAGRINYDSPYTYEKDGILYGYDFDEDGLVKEAWVLGLTDEYNLEAKDGVLDIPPTCNIGVKVTAIARDAFRDRKDLKVVKIPLTTMEIASTSFKGCNNLESIEIDPMNSYMIADGLHIYTKDFRTLITIINNSEKNIILPQSVLKIGEEAFAYDDIIESIEFTTKSTYSLQICNGAFRNCTNLRRVSAQNAELLKIASYSFAYCKNLNCIEPAYCEISDDGIMCLAWIDNLGSIRVKNLTETILKKSPFVGSKISQFDTDTSWLYMEDGYLMSNNFIINNQCKNHPPYPQIEHREIWANFKERETVVLANDIWHIEPGVFLNCPNLKEIYDNVSNFETIVNFPMSGTLYTPLRNRVIDRLASDDVLETCKLYTVKDRDENNTYAYFGDFNCQFVYDSQDNHNPWHDFKNWIKYTSDMPYYDLRVAGIEIIEAENAKVITNDGTIIVEGAEGKQVSVYSADGRLLYNGPAGETGVAGRGIYIVTIGASSVKVAL